jgi:hypothetical protein
MKVNKDQFDNLLSRMMKQPPEKTAAGKEREDKRDNNPVA